MLDVVDLVIGCHSRLVTIRIQTNILVSNLEANIIRLIRIWLDSQERTELHLRPSQVLDRIDDGSDPLIHKKSLTFVCLN